MWWGRGGGGGAKGESLSQWEMTNAICPEHSACVNPWRVPAGPHPTLRPLHPPPPPNPPNHSLCFHRVCGSVTEELGPLDGSAKCSFPSNMVRRASRPHQLRLCCTRLYSGIVMVAGWESYQPAGNDQQRLKHRTSGFASYNAFPSKLTKVFDLSSLCLHHVRMDLQAESVMKTLPGETLPGWCWSTIQHLRVAT